MREALRERAEKLDGIYAGNPKRATARSTTEMMLRVFVGISVVVISFSGMHWTSVTPLSTVPLRILDLIRFRTTFYQRIGVQSREAPLEMDER